MVVKMLAAHRELRNNGVYDLPEQRALGLIRMRFAVAYNEARGSTRIPTPKAKRERAVKETAAFDSPEKAVQGRKTRRKASRTRK